MLTTTTRRAGALAVLITLTALALPSSPAGATAKLVPVNAIVSATPGGKGGNGPSSSSDVSSNGRYVAFASKASDPVAGDTNATSDVFVRDTLTATTIRVSTTGAGAQANGSSDQATISRDGRYVAFRSAATNLVDGDTNGFTDVFVRDLRNKTTIRASVAAGSAAQAVGGDSSNPSLSGSGLQLAFESKATNIVPGDSNAKADVFVRDQDAGTMEQITVTGAEAPLGLGGSAPSISGTGRYVTFASATNEVGAFTDSFNDVFLRDRAAGTTERVSLSGSATKPNGSSGAGAVSDDGRYVAFTSMSDGLTMFTDAPGTMDVFVRDRTNASTDLVTRSTASVPSATGGTEPTISADGSKVAFSSSSPTLVSGDTNGAVDVFIRTVNAGTTNRWSVGSVGEQLAVGGSFPTISSDGTALSYGTASKSAYGPDDNGNVDVYVRTAFQIGPFAGSSDLVQRIAEDFTGSTLAPSALAAADKTLYFGTATPASMITTRAHGTFDDHRGPVLRLYWAFFKRAPDLGGLNYWSGKHANGMSIRTIANGFAKSNEFRTNFGGGTDSQFVTLVYTNVLDRQPDAAGLSHWVAKMQAGTTRGEMMTNFSESSEGIRKMRGEVDTVLVILGMLHRVPSTGEVISYANALELQGGQPTEVLATTLLTGAEFASTVN